MKCGHGDYPRRVGDSSYSGSTQRAVERHVKRCPGAQVFEHAIWLGLLGDAVCCGTCGRRIR